MYRKIYGSKHSDLSTEIIVGGVRRRIEFTGGVPFGHARVNARFATTDASIQNAIESDPRYGRDFFLEFITEIKENPREEKVGKVKAYNYITRIQDAINVLATNHKVPLDNMNSKSEVLAAAKKNNVSFPNLR